jgi:hypothetical protein
MLSICVCCAAQDTPRSQGTAPAPAFGQNVPILDPENPPLSGLDEPGLELKTSSRSFISAALQAGESVDTNASNTFSKSKATGVTHLLGAADLQKFWQKSDLFLEYLGGVGFGDNPFFTRQIQAAGLEGITRWRTGQLTLRDSFTYFPDGTFVGGGGLPGFGIATGGISLGLPGIYRLNGQFGTVGTIPRLSNAAILDVVQAVSPRSAFTVIGAFSNAHFYDNSENLLNGDQTTIEGGYSHLIRRHDQIAVVYAFQLFRFATKAGGEVYNDVVNVRWSHTITGRMSFTAGIGPQYNDLRYGSTPTKTWNVVGRATLRYRFEHSSLLLNYEKFTSQGSGLFPGADTQVAHLSFRRPLGRTYNLFLDAGFAHNHRLSTLTGGPNTYNDATLGFVVRKHLGRTYDLFGAYHFSEVWFDAPATFGSVTGESNQRHIATIGVEWHPRPIRIE